MPASQRLDPATLRYVISKIERELAGLDRITGRCALCRDAELMRVMGELRGAIRLVRELRESGK
jgi:hypothetical protein